MRFELVCVVAIVLGIAACETDYETCAKPGRTEACTCEASTSGQRTCLPERVWSECECERTPAAGDGADAGVPVSGASGSALAGGTGGTGGMGGMGGMRDAGGMGGIGGMPSTDASAMTDASDADVPELDGGADAAAGTGSEPPEGPAYASCTTATAADDCRSGSTCVSSDVTLLQPTALNVCAPSCTMLSDCPAPEGTGFTAMLTCTSNRCRLDCSGFPFPLTCPTGMACAAVSASLYCFDDGI